MGGEEGSQGFFLGVENRPLGGETLSACERVAGEISHQPLRRNRRETTGSPGKGRGKNQILFKSKIKKRKLREAKLVFAEGRNGGNNRSGKESKGCKKIT